MRFEEVVRKASELGIVVMISLFCTPLRLLELWETYKEEVES